MPFRKYTQCFQYDPIASPPFNEKDLYAFPIIYGSLVLSLTTGGLIIGSIFGPIGAVIGALVGFFGGTAAAVSTALSNVAEKWLNHRLVCLADEPQCAVGTVTEGPKYNELGKFDNDHFFDVMLMPHRLEDNYVTLVNPTSPKTERPRFGTVSPPQHAENIKKYPSNEIYEDKFQGEWFLRPNARFLPPASDLGYNDHVKDPKEMHTASMLHCEAEGDFWVRMKDLSLALGALASLGVGVAAAGAAAGGYAGSAAGCALGAWFFGPIGCLIGAIIGGLLGAAAGAAAAGGGMALIGKAVLQAISDAGAGNVEDANVGDRRLGKIQAGSRVAVLGEHVYDGFHAGWHEFHPLMAVMKIEADKLEPGEQTKMLQWDPSFDDGTPTPRPLPEAGGPKLTAEDMRQGLDSPRFRERAMALHAAWCTALRTAFDPKTRAAQQRLEHRWTIHPAVDGCADKVD